MDSILIIFIFRKCLIHKIYNAFFVYKDFIESHTIDDNDDEVKKKTNNYCVKKKEKVKQ